MKSINKTEIVKSLGKCCSFEVEIVDELPSTNDELASRARNGEQDDVLLIAHRQSAGRGRYDRVFFSPEGGLYFSILTHRSLKAADCATITAAMAVAVAEAIATVGDKRATIKWVNDVLIDGKKVCGILSQSSLNANGNAAWAIVGVGINLAPPHNGFPNNIKDIVTTVWEDIEDIVPTALLAEIVNRFSEYLNSYPQRTFVNKYKQLCTSVNKDVKVVRQNDFDDALTAHTLALDDNLAMIVRYSNGSLETLNFGEISLR